MLVVVVAKWIDLTNYKWHYPCSGVQLVLIPKILKKKGVLEIYTFPFKNRDSNCIFLAHPLR